MTIVLVHGNPETEAIWDDLVPHLRNDDVVRLSPPGFGCAIPSGFDCSTDAYRDWLAVELEKLAQPIDLVGHDWGGGHVIRIAMDRPGLIRSWTSDILGAFDSDYVWYDMDSLAMRGISASRRVARWPATAEARVERYVSLGTPRQRSESDRRREYGHGPRILSLVQISRSLVMRDPGQACREPLNPA
jgi:pimeloyl-ACP methyl ester carboxylesterase